MDQPLLGDASDLFAAPTSSPPEVVRVALPIPVDSLFDYAVPEAFSGRALPGCRVQVRFSGRPLTGVVVEPAAKERFAGRLSPIERILDEQPVLAKGLLDVLREEAREVLCPVGIALAAALPAGSAPRRVRAFALTPLGRDALASGALRGSAHDTATLLDGRPRTPLEVRREAGPTAEALLRALERDGLVTRIDREARPGARVRRVREVAARPGVDVAAETAPGGVLARAPRQAELLRAIVEHATPRLGRAVSADAAGPERLEPPIGPEPNAESEPNWFPTADFTRGNPAHAASLRALEKRGLVVMREREAPRDVAAMSDASDPGATAAAPQLTDDQSKALEPLLDAIRDRRSDRFLLHGVTGSGKTEVYLRAVGAALEAGRQALVLVPEITLTHQIVARLRGRFGDALAVLHSGLRPGERLEQWQRLRAGDTPIAAGARSALFAPLENLGVIIIDEEHDSAYKNDEGFRYHARNLAARRARQDACPVVMGSATPALETRFAADRGEIRRLLLAHRVGGTPLPSVEIVDLVREKERAPRGKRIVLSPPLRRGMAETLADGGQTILLLNRRGHSTQVLCFECGHAERCEHCDIALVFHARDERLRCHYCDFSVHPPEGCSSCGAVHPALLGLGTERLEEEVRTAFPEARIARLDRDTARRRGHTEHVLRSLHTGETQILIGTQMVAKGHDFPGVRLVGVVVADIGLHLPDFRASERTFQLLTQVAGRAGRDLAPGRVIVQTFVPRHYAIRPVARHDYETFYAEELGHRAALGYPPFAQLVHVLVTGPDETATRAAADELAGTARSALAAAGPTGPPDAAEDTELLGPAPCPLSRLRDRYRYQLLLKGAHRDALRRAAKALVAAAARLPDPLQATVDVNPTHML